MSNDVQGINLKACTGQNVFCDAAFGLHKAREEEDDQVIYLVKRIGERNVDSGLELKFCCRLQRKTAGWRRMVCGLHVPLGVKRHLSQAKFIKKLANPGEEFRYVLCVSG